MSLTAVDATEMLVKHKHTINKQNAWWPCMLNALQLKETHAVSRNTSKFRKRLHQFDSICIIFFKSAAKLENTSKYRNKLQRQKHNRIQKLTDFRAHAQNSGNTLQKQKHALFYSKFCACAVKLMKGVSFICMCFVSLHVFTEVTVLWAIRATVRKRQIHSHHST